MEVKLIGTRIDFPTQQVTGSDAAVLYIDLEQPITHFAGADLSIDVPGKGTLLVTLQVRMFREPMHPITGSTPLPILSQSWKAGR